MTTSQNAFIDMPVRELLAGLDMKRANRMLRRERDRIRRRARRARPCGCDHALAYLDDGEPRCLLCGHEVRP